MAGLISTGIWGFICSATMKAGKITATFISGATGWIIKNNGDAEFKSIYARDKIVTNEYVYNRIRVTEDEEVVTSNGKILASYLNDDGTYNVQLDLREGDINPFDANDLIQGYYHSPGNTGVIYAVQKMTVLEVLADQTMNVTCLSESSPYKYMVIVRVGNTNNPDRQSFIRISSRTNCQYFYDQITSFIDLDNHDKVKCAIGKLDVGLIPSWAVKAVGSIKRLFGLVADGVILRGIFILQNNKTIEDELEGVGKTITEVETRFEIREGQISSKIEETKTYAESAAGSASSASGSASSAADSASASEDAKVISIEKASEARQTVEGFTQTVTEKTEIVVNAANSAEGSANDAADSASASEAAKAISVEKAAEAKQTAEGFQTTVTEVTKNAVTDAVAGADTAIETKVGTAVTQSAKQWKVEVMGSDAQGNPNTVLAAINADASGVKIKGDKIQITGTLLAQIINADGLAIGNKSICLNKDGSGYLANENIRWDEYGYLYQKSRPRIVWRGIAKEMDEAGITSVYNIDLKGGTYIELLTVYTDNRYINLPNPQDTQGVILDIHCNAGTRQSSSLTIKCSTASFVRWEGGVEKTYSSVTMGFGSGLTGIIYSNGEKWVIDQNVSAE